MDIKAKIQEIETKLKKDPSLAEKFKKEPVKTIEGIIGVDLPDDQVNAIVDGVKAKMTGDAVAGVAGKLGGLLKK